ncbi:MAG: hypothetical protein AAF632_01960 [Bacteroidota bacterium]
MLPSSSLLVRFASLLTLIIVFTSSLQASPQHIFLLTNGQTHAEVPFTLVNNLIVVEVVIASERKMNFILDNGTANSVIFHRKYIKGLPLNLGRRITFRGAGVNNATRATQITGTSLHLSGAATDRIGMVVLDKNPFIHLQSKRTTIHGVLGSTLFRSFIVEIDYPNQLLRLHQHESFLAPDQHQALPMKVIKGKPYLSALVQGEQATMEMNLMLDLGFNNSLLLQVDNSLARKMMSQSRTATIGVGFSGKMTGRKGTVPAVLIGSAYQERVATIAPFFRSLPNVDPVLGMKRMGSVGNTLFQDTSIILNYPEEQFYIACPEPLLADHNEEAHLKTRPIEPEKLVF